MVENLADVLNRIPQRRRIGRTVREKDTVGLHRQNFGGRRPRRNKRHAGEVGERTQDVRLDAEIVGNDMKHRVSFAGERIRPSACHFRRIVPSVEPFPGTRLGDRLGFRDFS